MAGQLYKAVERQVEAISWGRRNGKCKTIVPAKNGKVSTYKNYWAYEDKRK